MEKKFSLIKDKFYKCQFIFAYNYEEYKTRKLLIFYCSVVRSIKSKLYKDKKSTYEALVKLKTEIDNPANEEMLALNTHFVYSIFSSKKGNLLKSVLDISPQLKYALAISCSQTSKFTFLLNKDLSGNGKLAQGILYRV